MDHEAVVAARAARVDTGAAGRHATHTQARDVARNAAGELVWRKVVTATGQGREAVRSEWRYPAVK